MIPGIECRSESYTDCFNSCLTEWIEEGGDYDGENNNGKYPGGNNNSDPNKTIEAGCIYGTNT